VEIIYESKNHSISKSSSFKTDFDNFFIDLFTHIICSKLLVSLSGVSINSQHSLDIEEIIEAKSESS
jgi:hypothetical protein